MAPAPLQAADDVADRLFTAIEAGAPLLDQQPRR